MSCSMDQSHVLSLTCGNRHQTGTDKTWTPSFGPLHMSHLDPLLDPSFGPLRENFSHSLHPPFMEFFLFFLRMRRSSSAKRQRGSSTGILYCFLWNDSRAQVQSDRFEYLQETDFCCRVLIFAVWTDIMDYLISWTLSYFSFSLKLLNLYEQHRTSSLTPSLFH